MPVGLPTLPASLLGSVGILTGIGHRRAVADKAIVSVRGRCMASPHYSERRLTALAGRFSIENQRFFSTSIVGLSLTMRLFPFQGAPVAHHGPYGSLSRIAPVPLGAGVFARIKCFTLENVDTNNS